MSARCSCLRRTAATHPDGTMARMPHISRRAALLLGVGAAAGALGGCAPDATAQPPPPPKPASTTAPTYVTGSFESAARGGRPTNWAIARPPGATGPLRPVILLHGRWSDATAVMSAFNVENLLAAGSGTGAPPFAVAAVDGGDNYWHKRAWATTPVPWCSTNSSPCWPTKAWIPPGWDLGWSMGGYGALLLGSRLGAGRTAAISATSPALWLSPAQAAPGAFDSAEDYDSNSVWGLPELGSIPLRIDCGTEDPFYTATRDFVARLHPPPAGGFSRGGHDFQFWEAQFPSELMWTGGLLVA